MPSQNKNKMWWHAPAHVRLCVFYGAPLASSIWMLTDLLPTCSRQKWRLCTRVKRLHYLHFDRICHTNLAFACFTSYFFTNERILSDVSHVSHNIFGITHYKTTTYFVRMYHTYCEKTSVRTPSAPRCHLPHQNNWFLPIESAPKQKREKTSMFFSYSTIQRT